MTLEQLKPCPFCGGQAKISQEEVICADESYYFQFVVMCEKCGANVIGDEDDENQQKVIDLWNRRVGE